MKQLRYMGEFLSRRGVTWRVELLQEADEAFDAVGSLRFDADEALLIEWDERSKEEVLCGSMATLSIESPGDRTYEDLYTEEPGRIRMDVYREGSLYWSGLLDAEFYEEPYEQASKYLVRLKFSDLGSLDRMNWDLSGLVSLRRVADYCLDRLGLNTTIDETLISSCLNADDSPLALADLTVRSDNFYDEDGDPSTLKEVLEGVLQPLGLRLTQRNGRLWVYDLNGLYRMGRHLPVEWDGDRQTMGVDVVYNNAKITWSTYAQSGNLLPTECWVLPADKNLTAMNLLEGRQIGESRLYSYHYSTDLWDWIDTTDCGFTLWTSLTGKHAKLLREDVTRFYKIVPQYDGQESQGIALLYPSVRGYKTGSSSNWTAQMESRKNGVNPAYLAGAATESGLALWRSAEVWVPPTERPGELMLRLRLNLLMDARFNPFEQAVNWQKWMEQKDWQAKWKARGNYVYVPVTLKFRPDGSDTVYAWDNRHIVRQTVDVPVKTLDGTKGVWRPYETNSDDTQPQVWGWLCWYNPHELTEDSGVADGWRMNRPAINPHKKSLSSVLKNCEDGQYIPYPLNGGGTLWMEVRADGWMINDAGTELSADPAKPTNPYDLWGAEDAMRGPRINWILMQMPELEVMNNVQFDATIDTDDVEYKAELNPHAKESIELETVCGSRMNGVQTARGCYFNSATMRQVTSLHRAGRTTQIEELLIGTLYSQFASRKTRLEGEAVIAAQGMTAYSERCQDGKLFLLTGDTQNLIQDTSQATLVELRPDEYKNKEEEA